MDEKELTKNVNEFEDICTGLRDLYERKNRDYGDSFHQTFKKFGLVMSAIRLGDKINRLETFIQKGDFKVEDESVEDTIRDIANYSIMTLMEIQRVKENKGGN